MSARLARPLAWLALFTAVAGCGKKGPPSGGPPDITPPTLYSASPDSGAAAVALDARLSLTFSEGMEPRATGDAVSLAPRVEVKQRRWSGRTLTLVLAESLKANQTYTMFVGSGARDLHGNNIAGGASVVFTTAAKFPAGALEGSIEARGFDAAGTYLWCYREGHQPDSTARDFDALGLADATGHFRVAGLPVPAHYRLWAFADLNRNRSFEPGLDVLAPADTVIALNDSLPVARGLRLRVVNPRAPARVRGAVLDSLAEDTTGVLRVVATSNADTTRRIAADPDERGNFDLQLPAGGWVIRAYRDLDRNRVWQRDREPASDPILIQVEPAADIQAVQLVLRRPARKAGP